MKIYNIVHTKKKKRLKKIENIKDIEEKTILWKFSGKEQKKKHRTVKTFASSDKKNFLYNLCRIRPHNYCTLQCNFQ